MTFPAGTQERPKFEYGHHRTSNLRMLAKIEPDKSHPANTADFVKKLARRSLDHDQVAVKMAPVFGLGNSVLAATRAKCLFSFFLPNIPDGAFQPFNEKFIFGNWGLPLPEWQLVLDLAIEHQSHPEWIPLDYPQDPKVYAYWDVNHHYARFLTRVMSEIRAPSNFKHLVFWVRDADIENGFWVLFLTLMYLHLEQERENERCAPLGQRIMRRLSIKLWYRSFITWSPSILYLWVLYSQRLTV
ncbi:hypothetical protein BJ170DRAFT_629938 [Xylariales sp. AK1849]|nr:hypothetical protein BJ170DRAFT_629938 [Xylariales sp. AK1849]